MTSNHETTENRNSKFETRELARRISSFEVSNFALKLTLLLALALGLGGWPGPPTGRNASGRRVSSFPRAATSPW